MITIEELLERHMSDTFVMELPGFQPIISYKKPRLKTWKSLLGNINEKSRHVKFWIEELDKFKQEMDHDEYELFEHLLIEHKVNSSQTGFTWTRISIHKDTLRRLEIAAATKCVSKSDIADQAIKLYCKSMGID
jgi:hypothetical protein